MLGKRAIKWANIYDQQLWQVTQNLAGNRQNNINTYKFRLKYCFYKHISFTPQQYNEPRVLLQEKHHVGLSHAPIISLLGCSNRQCQDSEYTQACFHHQYMDDNFKPPSLFFLVLSIYLFIWCVCKDLSLWIAFTH